MTAALGPWCLTGTCLTYVQAVPVGRREERVDDAENLDAVTHGVASVTQPQAPCRVRLKQSEDQLPVPLTIQGRF